MATYRVISRDGDGNFQQEDYKDLKALLHEYDQVGVEEDSYTMRLHGEPILKGLIGPLSQGKTIVCYETPAAFAAQTEVWSKDRRGGGKRSS